MSRLLPLLRSRTASSLRPGPAAAAAPRLPSWCGCGRGLLAIAFPGGSPGGPRALGTHPKEPMEALNTAQGARDFIYSLHSTERSCLLKELHRFESIAIAQGKGVGEEGDLGARRPPLPPCPEIPAAPRPGTPALAAAAPPAGPPRRPPSPAWRGAWDVRGGGNFPPLECPRGRWTGAALAWQPGPALGWLVPPQSQKPELQPKRQNRSCFDFVLICCVPPPPQPSCHSMLS